MCGTAARFVPCSCPQTEKGSAEHSEVWAAHANVVEQQQQQLLSEALQTW